MTRLVPNAFLEIIALNDSLKLELTPDQITKLQAGGDVFKVKSDSLVDKVANVLGDTTTKNPDPMTVFHQTSADDRGSTEAGDAGNQRLEGDSDAGAVGQGSGHNQVAGGLRREDGQGGRRGGSGSD